jgi:predicted 3-demethylubiquinone-9 3-methyltransferase (glyoxalase superfamily)
MPSIQPFLWYSKDAEEAARFYVSIFPNSSIDKVVTMPSDSPSGPAGSVVVVEFTLMGSPVTAMAAGPLDPFNHAISLMVECDTQAEVDRFYDTLLEGGAEENCGWVRDRYGLSWQIVPKKLNEFMRSSDRAAAKRATDARLTMKKLDIARLEAAYRG